MTSGGSGGQISEFTVLSKGKCEYTRNGRCTFAYLTLQVAGVARETLVPVSCYDGASLGRVLPLMVDGTRCR